MKFIFKIIFCVVFTFLITTNLKAQTAASATWALNSVTTTSVVVTGNVSATALSTPTAAIVRDYTSATGGGARFWINNVAWPVEAAYNSSRYYEFSISPQSGNNLTISNIAMDLGAGGTGNMQCMIYYSTDASFATSTLLGNYSAPGAALPNSAWLAPSPSWNVNVSVLSGATFYLRVYPYLSASSSATRYIWNRNVVITGTTIVPTTYALITNTTGSGAITLNPPGGSYNDGTNVTMTAASSAGWFFQGWSGDASGSDSVKVITVDGNKSVTAIFRKNITLTTNVDGSGSVSKSPNTATYLNGSNVTLTATSASGWDFKQWSGDFTGTDSNKAVTLGNSNQSVTAVFRQYARVTITREGPGYSDNVTPAPAPNGKYEMNTPISLNPSVHPSWKVSKIVINGVDTTAVALTNYVIKKHTTIKYVVVPKYPQYTLNVIALGNGSVDISPAPYNGTYDEGTQIFLKATPSPGYTFVAWTGKLSSYVAEQRIAMNENKIIFANFALIKATETSSSATWPLIANGSVTVTGDITADNQSFRGAEVNGYSGFNGSQRIRMAGTSNTWAANLTNQIDTVYTQFTVTTKPGKTFSVRTISMNLGSAASDRMKANIWYSTNANFSSPVLLNYSTGIVNNYLVKDGATSVSIPLNVSVQEGQTFYLRIYPWIEQSSVQTGKYVTVQNLVISNTITDGSSGNTALIPTVGSTEVSYITFNSAICKSNILEDGGADLTSKGFCWSTKSNPTIADNKLTELPGLGTFSSHITGLTSGTTYYIRAYATNSVGTAYGQEETFTTIAVTFKLNVNNIGSGKVICEPESNESLYAKNTTVKMTAVPSSGWNFSEWTGSISSKDNPINIKMDSVKTVNVVFQLSVGVENESVIPKEFSLNQNYPNPFNPTTMIRYSIPSRSNVRIVVFDLLGREIAELVNRTHEAGIYEIHFNAGTLQSGTYFYRIEAGNYMNVKKFVLVK